MARRMLLMIFLLSLAGTALIGCGSTSTTGRSARQAARPMAPMSMMPDDVKSAATTTREAYQFAAANPDVLQHIPCYCGCGSIGHTSNYACYIKSVESDGQLNFDSHALACTICVDITQDVMRLIKQGDSTASIKTYIDRNYSRYGASTGP